MLISTYTREAITQWATEPDEKLFAEATRLTREVAPRIFDMCSIVNGKSGKCSEDCKWCAQSAHHQTACEVYGLISKEECLRHAKANEAQGIKRFSIVNSGRRATPQELNDICDLFRTLRQETSLELCASLGLLDFPAMQQLAAAGVTRYHCNLEASPTRFPLLCTTHTLEDKVATLMAARAAGLSICSGGIIGMGETETDRIDLAFALRDLGVTSIPINILSPIPGTPLESVPLISEREILRTIALFRLIHPEAYLRFAGGRARLSTETLEAALRIGINSAIEGDLLTTLGKTVAQDKAYIINAGYCLP
jgi:adenosylmethionine-8-amino-7-oxononanoate aminotransferase